MTERPYQLLPPLDDEQRHLLRQSIEANGVLEPVVFDEDGEILDGHHRVEIAEELGIEYPRRVVDDLDEAGKRKFALTTNVARRQLTAATRGALVAQLRTQGMSIRQIAEATGFSRGTVANDLGQVSNSGQLPPEITGADGKTYAATKPRTASAPIPEDHPAPPAPDEGRSAGLPSALSGADESDASVVASAAAEQLPSEAEAPARPVSGAIPPPDSPARWTPEQHEANRLEIERKHAIEAAERFAKSLVMEVRGMVSVIIDGLDRGAPGILVSLADIDDCRAALDRLEERVMA